MSFIYCVLKWDRRAVEWKIKMVPTVRSIYTQIQLFFIWGFWPFKPFPRDIILLKICQFFIILNNHSPYAISPIPRRYNILIVTIKWSANRAVVSIIGLELSSYHVSIFYLILVGSCSRLYASFIKVDLPRYSIFYIMNNNVRKYLKLKTKF